MHTNFFVNDAGRYYYCLDFGSCILCYSEEFLAQQSRNQLLPVKRVKEGVKNLHKNIQQYVSMVSWVP